jgi:hypothetical protein
VSPFEILLHLGFFFFTQLALYSFLLYNYVKKESDRMILKFVLTAFEEKTLHLCLTAFLILVFILLCMVVLAMVASLFGKNR